MRRSRTIILAAILSTFGTSGFVNSMTTQPTCQKEMMQGVGASVEPLCVESIYTIVPSTHLSATVSTQKPVVTECKSKVGVVQSDPPTEQVKKSKRRSNRGLKRSIFVLDIIDVLIFVGLMSGSMELVTAFLAYLLGVLILTVIGVLMILWLVSSLANMGRR
jgi:hypothetical protein